MADEWSNVAGPEASEAWRIRLSLTGRLGSVPRRPEPANVADGTFGAEPKVRRRYDFDFATP